MCIVSNSSFFASAFHIQDKDNLLTHIFTNPEHSKFLVESLDSTKRFKFFSMCFKNSTSNSRRALQLIQNIICLWVKLYARFWLILSTRFCVIYCMYLQDFVSFRFFLFWYKNDNYVFLIIKRTVRKY